MAPPTRNISTTPGALGRCLRASARLLAGSVLLKRGREVWKRNQKDWHLPLSKADKLLAGTYLILEDYSAGLFPPRFLDQQQTHENEIACASSLPGVSPEQVGAIEMRKPFWFGPPFHRYMGHFGKLVCALEGAPLSPPAKLLELGGGCGWTAELLATFGFKVTSTTLSGFDSGVAKQRKRVLDARGLDGELEVVTCPMESVARHVAERCPFDGVFVFEALHHAFNWRATLTSAFACLRPGGWLFICDEPNVLHTAVSYRVAKLSNTHEIGFRKAALVAHLKSLGFRRVISFGKRPHLFFRPHWLMAQKP